MTREAADTRDGSFDLGLPFAMFADRLALKNTIVVIFQITLPFSTEKREKYVLSPWPDRQTRALFRDAIPK